jgi:hypothetical protein
MSKNILFFVVVVIVGALLGSFLGKFVGQAFPGGSMIKDLLGTEISAGLNPTTLDLRIIDLTFGCMIKLNMLAVLGMVVSALAFKTFLK